MEVGCRSLSDGLANYECECYQSDRDPTGKRKPPNVKTRLYSAEMSRRGLLPAAACAAAGVAVAGRASRALAKGKRSKTDVEYQDFPHGVEPAACIVSAAALICSNCASRSWGWCSC